ncbi:MAG: hypothetical protein HY445_03235 [Candidatus Niyogibacteria bacterium]|nr:hypothetical protein [Candidatus Niyogibacteria bacterium]
MNKKEHLQSEGSEERIKDYQMDLVNNVVIYGLRDLPAENGKVRIPLKYKEHREAFRENREEILRSLRTVYVNEKSPVFLFTKIEASPECDEIIFTLKTELSESPYYNNSAEK